jgi:hypothetical protein
MYLLIKVPFLNESFGQSFFISVPSDSVRLQNALLTRKLRESSSSDDLKQNNHNSNHQKSMNETSHGIGSDQTQKPQYNQNNCDSVKHNNPAFLF